MRLIDFDEKYAEYAEKWIRDNAGKYKNFDDMEAHLPDMLLLWLNTPADWLDGVKPGMYFQKYTDPDELVALFAEYEKQSVDVPDMLLDRIVEMGETAVPALMEIAKSAEMNKNARVTALNLMIEIGTSVPMALCLSLIDQREAIDELADVAAELLEALGQEPVAQMLSRLDSASDAAILTYLDLLCNFPGDERIYTYTVRQLRTAADDRALYASYLGKLGDERAIAPLREILALSDLNYLDYIEVRSAIEALGGEVDGTERDFTGDEYYESLSKIE